MSMTGAFDVRTYNTVVRDLDGSMVSAVRALAPGGYGVTVPYRDGRDQEEQHTEAAVLVARMASGDEHFEGEMRYATDAGFVFAVREG